MDRYNVVINGMETELQLSDEDAKARGLKASDKVSTKAKTPENKASAPAKRAAARKTTK